MLYGNITQDDLVTYRDILALIIGYDFFSKSKITFDKEIEGQTCIQICGYKYDVFHGQKFNPMIQKICSYTWSFIVGCGSYCFVMGACDFLSRIEINIRC